MTSSCSLYPVTVCGLTFELPEVHKWGYNRKRQRQWYFRAIIESRGLEERFTGIDRATVSGATVRVLVTPEEERGIWIADLRRQRDILQREQRYTAEKLRMIEKRLSELGA